jgi:phosphatidylethanolamine-binding protein (PEBP) family uncharacterized protein
MRCLTEVSVTFGGDIGQRRIVILEQKGMSVHPSSNSLSNNNGNPHLTRSDAPKRVKSLVLVCHDLDALGKTERPMVS